MTVYVDEPVHPFGRMVMCHMFADSRAELIAMADRIGVERRWLQDADTHREHFDVCKSKRALAIAGGAVELDLHGVADLLNRRRQSYRDECAEPPMCGADALRSQSSNADADALADEIERMTFAFDDAGRKQRVREVANSVRALLSQQRPPNKNGHCDGCGGCLCPDGPSLGQRPTDRALTEHERCGSCGLIEHDGGSCRRSLNEWRLYFGTTRPDVAVGTETASGLLAMVLAAFDEQLRREARGPA